MNDNPTTAKEQYELGQKYFRGDGVPINYKMMMHWYTKAAEQGHAGAQYMLGSCYDSGYGVGVPQDVEKAAYWYGKAAAQGDKLAQEKFDTEGRFKRTRHGFCYVATCVYGSYDSPEVWTLRRYRDTKLSKSWFGRRFIQVYYAVSPKIVEVFGNKKWFNRLFKPILNKLVRKLQNSGIDV